MRSRTTALDGQSEVQVLMGVLFEEAAMRQAFALKHLHKLVEHLVRVWAF